MDIPEFFEGMLPAVIAHRKDTFDAKKGVLSIAVHGVGEWTIRFGDHRAEDAISTGVELDADLVVAIDKDAFFKLLGGEKLTEKDRKPVTLGDPSLLDRLGRLLWAPARGGLGARLDAKL
jgi:hypothetical protein